MPVISGYTASSSHSNLGADITIDNGGGDGILLPGLGSYWDLSTAATVDAVVGISVDGPVDAATNQVQGFIYGAVEAAFLGAQRASLINYGTLFSDQIGVSLINDGTLINQVGGLIDGGSSGVGAVLGKSAYSGESFLVVNQGTIIGQTGVAVQSSVTAVGTLVNAGLIQSSQGSSGQAVELGQGGLLELKPTSLIVGTASAIEGSLALYSLSNLPGTVSGIGSSFTGFDTISIQNSSTWAISGDTAGLASGQEIMNFGPGDVLTLAGLQGVPASPAYEYGSGGLIVAGSTIDLQGAGLATGDFMVSGNAGSIIIGVKPEIGVTIINVNTLPGIDTTGARDDTMIINNAINAVPNGETIDLNFGAGTFAIDGTIMLRSDTNVLGSGATIATVESLQTLGVTSQFTNQDFAGSGTQINQNISIRGLTFVYPQPDWNITIWFQNVNNVVISGNTFLAANNGDIAVLDASNTVISGNVADGNINFAYNGWNGLSNVAVNNNSNYQSGSAAGSGGYFFNGTFLSVPGQLYPGGNYQGDQFQNYLSNNISAGALPGGSGFGVGSIGIGYTVNENSNLQGNLYAANGTPSTFGFIDGGAGLNNTMQGDIVSQHVAGNPENTNAFASNGGGAGSLAAVGAAVIGTEVFGSTRSFAEFQNIGDASTTSNDVIIGAQNAAEYTPLVGAENVGAAGPVVSGVGGSIGFGTLTNGPVALGITVSGTDNLFVEPNSLTLLPGIFVSDAGTLGNELITLVISDIFGILSVSGETGQTITLQGAISQINNDLTTLSFMSNVGGWNDDIHFSATDGMGNRAVWDVAVGVAMAAGAGGQGIGTFSSANSTNQLPNLQQLINDPVPPPLGGDTLVVQGGGHEVTMGGPITMVLTGDGSNTILGGSSPEYIQTNTGPVRISLDQGGDVTVSGGIGGISVQAASGNDLIQSSSGTIQAVLGTGADTVLSGIGGASVTGGSGLALVTTLPQDNGPLNVTLGSGGGIVYDLSGQSTIQTQAGAGDTIYAGQGNANILSNGFDQIYAGSGDVSIGGGARASDTVIGGSGSLYLQAGSGATYLAPGSGSNVVVAGSGNLVIAPTGQYLLNVVSLTGADRTIELGGSGLVDVINFASNPFSSETLSAGLLAIQLNDGTKIVMADAAGKFLTSDNGTLTNMAWSVAGTGTAAIIPGTAGSTLVVGGPSVTLSGQLDTGSPTVLSVDPNGYVALDNLVGGSSLDQLTLSGSLLDVQGNLAVAGIDLSGGQFQIDPATVTATGITGTGAVTIDANTSLGVSGSIGNGVTIAYNGLDGALGIETLSNLAGTIEGFSATDTIDFYASGTLSETYTTSANGGGILSVFQGATQIGAVDFAVGSFSSSSFMLANLGNGSEQIAVACFTEGTPIRTPQGDRPVEQLQIGDHVTTYDGRTVPIKWLARKTLSGAISQDDFPVLFPTGCLGRGLPTCNLAISADHALLIGGLLLPAGLLCNGEITRTDPGPALQYYHIETEDHEVVLAAGVAAETFIDVHNRSGFDNADEYKALYGKWLTRPVLEFAPRVTAGELACSAIANAFGSSHFTKFQCDIDSQLRGHLDQATATDVQGWALAGDKAVVVEISVNGRLRGYVSAGDFRADLREAGVGGGYAAFHFEFERPLPSSVPNVITARIAGSSFVLDGAPVHIPVTSGLSGEVAGTYDRCGAAEAAVETARASLIAVRADSRRVALVLDDSEPDPDRDAGSEAILCHTAALVQIGYRVIFVTKHGITSPKAIQAIQHAGAVAVMAAGGRAIETILDTTQIDLAFIHRPIVAIAYAGLVRARSPQCRIVMSVADLEHVRFESLFRLTGLQRYGEERALSLCRLNQAMHMVDQVLTHSTVEKLWLNQNYPNIRTDVLLWTPSVRRYEADFSNRSGAGFVGNMGHAPNMDAVFYIDKVVEPALRSQGADFEFKFYGSQFPESFSFLERPGISFSGHVADLGVTLSRLRMTVAPLRAGAGVKGKVLSSLQAGVPCVMSTVAAEGLELSADLKSLVTDDVRGIASRMIAIHETEGEFRKYSEAGATWADDFLAPSRIRRQLEFALFDTSKERRGASTCEPRKLRYHVHPHSMMTPVRSLELAAT